MTNKIYRSAQGKAVDLGALLLQNEQVRAVGNMNVNARGDLLDDSNNVIDEKAHRVQRQYHRQTQSQTPSNVSKGRSIATSTVAAKKLQQQFDEQSTEEVESESDIQDNDLLGALDAPLVAETTNNDLADTPIPKGGLAAAIARSKEIKQELEKTPRQRAQETGLKKI